VKTAEEAIKERSGFALKRELSRNHSSTRVRLQEKENLSVKGGLGGGERHEELFKKKGGAREKKKINSQQQEGGVGGGGPLLKE